MQHIDVNQAQQCLLQLLEAASKGEEIIITRDNRPVAKLAPVAAEAVIQEDPWLDSAKGLIFMHDDFDEPLDELFNS